MDTPGPWWQASALFIAVATILMLMGFLLNVPACVAKRYRPWVQNLFCSCGVLLFIGGTHPPRPSAHAAAPTVATAGTILALVGFTDLAQEPGQGAVLPPDGCRICSPDSSAFQIGGCRLGYSMIVMLCTCGIAIVTGCVGFSVTSRGVPPFVDAAPFARLTPAHRRPTSGLTEAGGSEVWAARLDGWRLRVEEVVRGTGVGVFGPVVARLWFEALQPGVGPEQGIHVVENAVE